jgi:hypothetical protein
VLAPPHEPIASLRPLCVRLTASRLPTPPFLSPRPSAAHSRGLRRVYLHSQECNKSGESACRLARLLPPVSSKPQPCMPCTSAIREERWQSNQLLSSRRAPHFVFALPCAPPLDALPCRASGADGLVGRQSQSVRILATSRADRKTSSAGTKKHEPHPLRKITTSSAFVGKKMLDLLLCGGLMRHGAFRANGG